MRSQILQVLMCYDVWKGVPKVINIIIARERNTTIVPNRPNINETASSYGKVHAQGMAAKSSRHDYQGDMGGYTKWS